MPSAIGFPPSPTVGQQHPTVSPTREWNGSVWRILAISAVPSTPVELRLSSLTNTDDFIAMRVISGELTPHLVSALVVADFAGGTPTATKPSAFTVGMWTITPITGGLAVAINSLPSDGGSAITALQYTLNGGTSWIAFAGTGTGTRNITGLPASLQTIQIRAVNAVDNADPSDTKSDTPLASGGGTLTFSQNSTGADFAGGASATYRNGGGTNAGYWEPGVNTAAMLWRPGANFNTTNITGVITSAILRIYMSEQFGASTVTAYDNLRVWVNEQVSWTEYAAGSSWQTAGGGGASDRSGSSIGTEAAPATNGVWVEIELDAAVVETWRQEGGVGASGAQLVGSDQYSTFITDIGTDGFRPELVVTHA